MQKLRVKLPHRCLLGLLFAPSDQRCSRQLQGLLLPDHEGSPGENAVELLLAEKLSAGFRRSEFGPRALAIAACSHRLAPYVKENLNDFIKHREVSVPLPSRSGRRCIALFRVLTTCESMNSLARVREGVDGLLKGSCSRGLVRCIR